LRILYLHLEFTGPRAQDVLNDDFSDAYTISDSRGIIEGNNTMATREPNEPDHAGKPGGKSVWYAWTAPASGTVTFDTSGSDFDTLLAVYRGSSVDNLTTIAANDDAEDGGYTSRVDFSAVQGVEYRIAVDGYDAEEGHIVLSWR
jgi:hypothetical protein